MKSQRKQHSAACLTNHNPNHHLPPPSCVNKKKQIPPACENCCKPQKNATAPVKVTQKSTKKQVAIQTSNAKDNKNGCKDVAARSASKRVHSHQEDSTVPSRNNKRASSYPRKVETSKKEDVSLQITDDDSADDNVHSRFQLLKNQINISSETKLQDSHLKPPAPQHRHVRHSHSESGPSSKPSDRDEPSSERFNLDHQERQLQRSQQEILSMRSRLYHNERKMETMHNEIRRLEREGLLKEEKNRFIVQENQLANSKTAKYKKIAKTLKAQIEQIEQTVSNLKKIGQDETKTLQQNIKFLERAIRQKQHNYITNLKTIAGYLQRLQKMIVPTDNNFSFNSKIVGDLIDLCVQLSKQANEEDHKLKESLLSKSYVNEEFLLSETSHGSGDDNQMSEKTQRLLDDYQRLKYESDHLKAENHKLKQIQESVQKSTQQTTNEKQNLVLHQIPMSTHFESRESTTKRNQSLSVADLLQYDSVSLLNSKLEEKNQILEDQLNQMKNQMNQLAEKTKELFEERENFKQQINSQNSYILSLAAQVPSVVSSKSHSNLQTDDDEGLLNIPSSREDRPFIQSQHESLITQTKRFNNKYVGVQDDNQKTKKQYENTSRNIVNIRQEESHQISNKDQDSEVESSQPSSRYQRGEDKPPRSHVFETSNHEERKMNQTAHVALSFKQVHSFKPPSSYIQSSSEIDSGRRDHQSFRSKQNIFKHNQHYYVEDKNPKQKSLLYTIESDKENTRGKASLNSARMADSMSFQGSNKKKHKFAHESTKYQALPFKNSIKSGFQGTSLSNTSPLSIVLKKQDMKIDTSSSIKRPVSMASTTTLVINEKAKALRDEICTLDSEIQQLQKNLKTAIQNKEKRSSSIR